MEKTVAFFKRMQKNDAFRTEKNAVPNPGVNCFSLYASAMPRAQNMTAKVSILREEKIL